MFQQKEKTRLRYTKALIHVITHELYENSECNPVEMKGVTNLSYKTLDYFLLKKTTEFDRNTLCLEMIYLPSVSYHFQKLYYICQPLYIYFRFARFCFRI